MADSIKQYGKEKGYDIIFARIYENKFNDDIVSCRIVVPESQSEELIGSGTRAWPRNVTCRRWSDEPPTGQSDKYKSERTNQHSKTSVRGRSDWIGSRLNRGRVGASTGRDTSDWETDCESISNEEQKRRIWYKKFAEYMFAFSNDEAPWNTKS